MLSNKYHLSSRILHWSMALIIISLLAMGFFMTNLLDPEATNRMFIYNLHKSFGVLVLVLLLPRIFAKITKKAPPLPATMPKLIQKAAHIGHLALYFLMFAMPISGYLMSNSFGYGVKLFGLQLPMIAQKNIELGQFFASCHKYLGFAFVTILLVHIGAVIKHRFFDVAANDVLKRMV
jgi:cytochrome b561